VPAGGYVKIWRRILRSPEWEGMTAQQRLVMLVLLLKVQWSATIINMNSETNPSKENNMTSETCITEMDPETVCDCCGETCEAEYLTFVGNYGYCDGCMEDGEVLESDNHIWG
jgi:hypothetical protein